MAPTHFAPFSLSSSSDPDVGRRAGVVEDRLVTARRVDLDRPGDPVVRRRPVGEEGAVRGGRAALHAAVGDAVAGGQHGPRERGVPDRERPVVARRQLGEDVALPAGDRLREPLRDLRAIGRDVLRLPGVLDQVEELTGGVEAVALVAGAGAAGPVLEQDAIGRVAALAEQPGGEADPVERPVADAVDPGQVDEGRVQVDGRRDRRDDACPPAPAPASARAAGTARRPRRRSPCGPSSRRSTAGRWGRCR